MGLIDEKIAAQLREEFQGLVGPVRLVVFSQTLADPGSEDVKRLVEELAALDPRLSFEEVNFVLEPEKVAAFGITRTPAIAIVAPEKDHGIRMYGLPSGYEFGSLIDAILSVSKGTTSLSPDTKAALAKLEQPVHIQVFSTPTCPYCPRATELAFEFAIESERVTADGIEVTGYPELAQRYRVSGVPKTVVGEAFGFVGAQGEPALLEAVQQAAAAAAPKAEAAPTAEPTPMPAPSAEADASEAVRRQS
jgi:glutaredoxin-like protein